MTALMMEETMRQDWDSLVLDNPLDVAAGNENSFGADEMPERYEPLPGWDYSTTLQQPHHSTYPSVSSSFTNTDQGRLSQIWEFPSEGPFQSYPERTCFGMVGLLTAPTYQKSN